MSSPSDEADTGDSMPPDGADSTAGPDPTDDPTTGDTPPECVPDSVCCAPDGTFLPDGASGPGCTSDCSTCDGVGGCVPEPSGLSCGGGSGTCDGMGGCDVPTCGDGAQTIDPGEQCDGNNLGNQTCQSQGYDGGSLSCQANCSFDTTNCYQASIVPSPGLNSWTPVFVPDDNCMCDASNPDCHTLYQGRVNSIVGNVAQMQFRKMNGGPPSVDVSYWVVVGELYPTCLQVHAYTTRTTGTWSSSTDTLTVDVNIWPSQVDFDDDPCGTTKDLFVITGGGGGFENVRLWYQEQAVRFTKVCS